MAKNQTKIKNNSIFCKHFFLVFMVLSSFGCKGRIGGAFIKKSKQFTTLLKAPYRYKKSLRHISSVTYSVSFTIIFNLLKSKKIKKIKTILSAIDISNNFFKNFESNLLFQKKKTYGIKFYSNDLFLLANYSK